MSNENNTTTDAQPLPQADTTAGAATIPKQDKGDPRLDAYIKNLVFLHEESIALTGLPLDALLVMVYRNASASNLRADGQMVQYGGSGGFVPDKNTLTNWATAYFQAIKEAQIADARRQANAAVPPAEG